MKELDLLEVENLSAGYGGPDVIQKVSFSLSAGEIVAVVGANAAGKTTLINTISGLLKPSTGRIIFKGKDITSYSAAHVFRTGIAQVPQGRALFSGMNVEENLQLGMLYRQKAKENYCLNLNWVYQLFPRLKERSRQAAGTLSGGEQQMLAVARALMSEPELLLIDEPSLGLSPVLVNTLFKTISEINGKGVTVLLVEQNVKLSLKTAGRAYILEHGKVVKQGSSGELLKDKAIHKAYLGI